MNNRVIAFDLGGTKLASAVVDDTGKVFNYQRCLIEPEKGPNHLFEQIANISQTILDHTPDILSVGIASAGPLDPISGCLLDPTNFSSNGATWGRIALIDEISKRTQLKVYLENDAAAALIGECWQGDLQSLENGVVMTLGTGVGVGVKANNQLVRAGRHLHPEVSHIRLNAWDSTAPCGCGNLGCIEAYLSGKNFSERMARRWGEPGLTGEKLVLLARNGNKRALAAFHEYSEFFALAVEAIVILFAPEKIVVAGGFAGTLDLFLESAHKHLEKLLARRRVGIDLYPQIVASKLSHYSGLLGAAKIAFEQSRTP